jgi:hypothetical protein
VAESFLFLGNGGYIEGGFGIWTRWGWGWCGEKRDWIHRDTSAKYERVIITDDRHCLQRLLSGCRVSSSSSRDQKNTNPFFGFFKNRRAPVLQGLNIKKHG